MNKQNIVIGGAWPYANNSLHLGHLAGLISGDILARYHRAKGDAVSYVSGTDCHGTPITERAKRENKTPKEVSEYYHSEFVETFNKMGFSYSLYTKTETEYHSEKVQAIFKRLYDNGYIYEKIEPESFCSKCNKFLADREIQFTCPKCGSLSKADQCENCRYVPGLEDLKDGVCLECGETTIQKDNKNLYLALSKFQDEIQEYVNFHKNLWRLNAKNETEKYLKQGLLDRAVTRDLDWGIDIPIPGYEKKKMYVWIEAVLGYVTATMKYCEDNKLNWEDFWKEGSNNKVYMCHGKDNIVFHSIIFNSLVMGQRENYKTVDMIVSSEYLNINDDKISKSKGNGVTALQMLEQYDADSLRYYIINNGPEKKDSNFTIENFEATHNGEILNKFGNLVNRTLRFKGIEVLPKGEMNKDVDAEIEKLYKTTADLIEHLEFKEATERIMQFVEYSNRFYDEKRPWIQKKEDEAGFNNTIYTCANIIANLSNLFEPFMPFACKKIREYLGIDSPSWEKISINSGVDLTKVEPLFNKIEKV